MDFEIKVFDSGETNTGDGMMFYTICCKGKKTPFYPTVNIPQQSAVQWKFVSSRWVNLSFYFGHMVRIPCCLNKFLQEHLGCTLSIILMTFLCYKDYICSWLVTPKYGAKCHKCVENPRYAALIVSNLQTDEIERMANAVECSLLHMSLMRTGQFRLLFMCNPRNLEDSTYFFITYFTSISPPSLPFFFFKY
ncbi:uncharacterized protein LOC126355473 [Schistocerca gregaria]|uniref:uncharacterized protein LOC126355473 n=1 Tax=Schistocerca gregaria TaxID=7010 RepID=UPI00211F20D7|nr:uncharacterized protein LOC126355473 [Schistocerca gregaria]